MNNHFIFSKSLRIKIAVLYKSLSIEQINTIPKGFKNNLAWHLGHIVITPAILCYQRTEVQPQKEIQYIDKYKNGTKPESTIDQQEVDYFLNQLIPSLEEIEKDYSNGVFKNIQSITTMTFGVTMNDIETVFQCCSNHDAIHFGQIQAIIKLLNN